MREARPRRAPFFGRPSDATEERPGPKIEAELEPVDPGVWAAWARERERELTTAVPNRRPGTTCEPRMPR